MGIENTGHPTVAKPFSPRAEGLNLNNALFLASASQLAYRNDASAIQETVKNLGFDKFQDFHSQTTIETEEFEVLADTYGYVCSNADALAIVFRGTQPENIRNWLTNAMIRTVPLPPGAGKVHKGFWIAFASVWESLRAILQTQRVNDQAVWITGHSLGGALAMMCAAQLLWGDNTPVQGVYTFGQPRAGDYTFATQFNADFRNRCFRFVNNNDIVPQLPPPGPILRYWHTDGLQYIDASGKLHASLPWWQQLIDMIRGALQDIGQLGPDLLKDHDIGLYVRHLERLT